MPETLLSDPILARFRAAPDKVYGNSLERVVLFGSRARGDARQDPDYDVAVFLRDLSDRRREIHRLAAIETDILAETGAFIHAMPYRAGCYRERSPLMHEIRREGMVVPLEQAATAVEKTGRFIQMSRSCSTRCRRRRNRRFGGLDQRPAAWLFASDPVFSAGAAANASHV
jgi:predicted nucleotidyltransferase